MADTMTAPATQLPDAELRAKGIEESGVAG